MSTVQISKRLLCILAFLFVAIPVLVGTLVWHYTEEHVVGRNSGLDPHATSPGAGGNSSSRGGGGQTSTEAPPSSPPTATTTPLPREPTPEEVAAKPWLALRLPDSQTPLHYDITLYPDFYDDHGTFYGNETVEVKVTRATRFLLIHVYRLTIQDVGLVKVKVRAGGEGEEEEEVEVARSFEEPKNQFLVVEAREEVAAGSVVRLSLAFSGSLTESIVGFYKSRYVNSKTGETR